MAKSPKDPVVTIQQDRSVEVGIEQASQMVAALKEGQDRQAIARSLGVPLEAIRSTEELRAVVAGLVGQVGPFYLEDPEARRRITVAKLLEQMLTAAEPKDQIAAARALPRVDPDAWPQQQTGPLVNITLSDEIRSLDAGDLWKKTP